MRPCQITRKSAAWCFTDIHEKEHKYQRHGWVCAHQEVAVAKEGGKGAEAGMVVAVVEEAEVMSCDPTTISTFFI